MEKRLWFIYGNAPCLRSIGDFTFVLFKWEKGFLQRSASFEWSGMPVPRTLVLVGCRTTDAVGQDDSKRSRWCFRYVVSQRSACSQRWVTLQFFLGLNLHAFIKCMEPKLNRTAQLTENDTNVFFHPHRRIPSRFAL